MVRIGSSACFVACGEDVVAVVVYGGCGGRLRW